MVIKLQNFCLIPSGSNNESDLYTLTGCVSFCDFLATIPARYRVEIGQTSNAYVSKIMMLGYSYLKAYKSVELIILDCIHMLCTNDAFSNNVDLHVENVPNICICHSSTPILQSHLEDWIQNVSSL